MQLADDLLAGNRRALARTISLVEDSGAGAHAALAALYTHTGRSHVIGVTGAPGTGKSTLVSALAKVYRACGQTVGIIAVDPTSPFSGGALLGDRVRMRDLAGDPGVFIRSMATRGSLGGLARATADVILILDAAGFDRILVETVGVGQAEVEIASAAHTTIVVEAPGLGDDIQAIKAGILEIADLFAINKADREGADQVEREIEAMKSLAMPQGWDPPVLRTVAQQGTGIPELLVQLREHGRWLRKHGGLARKARERARLRFDSLLAEAALRRAKAQAGPERLEAALQGIADRTLDPYSAVAGILGEV